MKYINNYKNIIKFRLEINDKLGYDKVSHRFLGIFLKNGFRTI